MTDNGAVTGSRDDLVVDASRCLPMRFCESSCRRCADICPHGAVSLEGGLSIDPRHCRGCLLCTAACPSGALEQNGDFSACLARLSRVPEPVLGCFRTKGCANGTVPCLGGLSEEHLVALSHALTGRLTLNLSACGDCANSRMIVMLGRRLDAIAEAGLSGGTCRIVIAESAGDIRYRDEPLDRRSFFRSFGRALFKSADIVLSGSSEQTGQRSGYAEKKVPYKRRLLNRTRSSLSRELQFRLSRKFDTRVSFGNSCTRCQGCVAICPTGALKSEQPDSLPTSDQLLCTGCGLCGEFCMESAIRISPLRSERD